MSGEAPELECLHCGQTKAQIKRDQTICGIEGGYEYVELIAEWPRHRWVDWTDKELTRYGIRPEAFAKYRRQPITQFEYVDCADTIRGHNLATEPFPDMGIKPGQCWNCGHTKGAS